MEIEIKIDPQQPAPKIIILTPQMTEDVKKIVEKLENNNSSLITGFLNEKIEIIPEDEIIYIYTDSGKVFASTKQGEYNLRQRIFELEEKLTANKFIRISNSEIINLQKVKNFDLSFTRTICVKLINGHITYVARRYVPKLKKVLNI